MDVFSRYAPFVREFVHRAEWQRLRPVQAAAGEAVFATRDHVLLCASTASGKTEAAFFPILTLLSEDPPAGVGCLYVAPLKALINDQFERLGALCEEADIAVTHWHGDVAAGEKRRLLKNPSGILQITPESLEAILLRRRGEIPRLFGDLRFVVLDEIHSFLRSDRGEQTLCLVERLSRLAGCDPRRIALSATVGDPEAVGRRLAAGTRRGTVIPRIPSEGVEWRLSMEHFFSPPPQADEAEGSEALPLPAGGGGAPPPVPPPTDTAPEATDPAIAYLFERTRGSKCLVFSNSREECEVVTSTLRRCCALRGEPDRFLIHHGNLSAALRQDAEAEMREEDSRETICTTATLELGIDVGRLERAFQIDAPWTVSSFLQRMGRTGRRGAPGEMHFVMREEHPESRANLPESLPWPLLQGIALVQLYLEERWVEPPREGKMPFSLLFHQTMATLAAMGEATPAELAGQVLTLSAFRNVSADDFRTLLRHLVATDRMEATGRGTLLVGLAGEKLVNSFKFFAVFRENEEYAVRAGGGELGTIVRPPPEGERIAIAGKVWVVEEVDHVRHLVHCHAVDGIVPAYFGECAGDLATRIVERMRGVLREERGYPYLMPHAAARLAQARRSARLAGIAETPLVSLGGRLHCLFPWLGSYAFLALERLLRRKCAAALGLKAFASVRPYYMTFTLAEGREKDFFRIVREEAEKDFDPLELLGEREVPVFEKYDEFVPAELVRKGFALGVLDLAGMRRRVRGWTD